LLMVVGFVSLLAVIVIPVLPSTVDNASVTNYMTSLLCQPGEKLVREQYKTHDSDGNGYSMTPYCVNSERQREDVTGRWVLIGVGGFLAPFLIGLLMLVVGASAASRRQHTSRFQAVPNSYGGTDFAMFNSGNGTKQIDFDDGTLKVNGFEIKMDGLTQEKIEALKSQMQVSAGGGDLTTKLKQIQDAKDNGLISSDEYDRLRKKILDDLG
ncbi:MAG: SHOCT domain-containing protein, partial [Anaerolineae bacterium]|nr:SHOCT domain-containing protein [Anaerolineae bacterium]